MDNWISSRGDNNYQKFQSRTSFHLVDYYDIVNSKLEYNTFVCGVIPSGEYELLRKKNIERNENQLRQMKLANPPTVFFFKSHAF